MNGDPSRRLEMLAGFVGCGMCTSVLVEEQFRVMSTGFDRFSNAAHAIRICLWPLEESAISSQNIVHAVLCCAVEF